MNRKYTRKQITEAIGYWRRMLAEAEKGEQAQKALEDVLKIVGGASKEDKTAAGIIKQLSDAQKNADGEMDEGTKRALFLTGVLATLATVVGTLSLVDKCAGACEQAGVPQTTVTQIVNLKQVNILIQQCEKTAAKSGNKQLVQAVKKVKAQADGFYGAGASADEDAFMDDDGGESDGKAGSSRGKSYDF